MHSTVSLTIRSATEVGDQRILEGIATTGEIDRMGDIVEPLGIINPQNSSLPLLIGHNATLPVGRVTLGKATTKGVPFTARIARIDEPGTLQDRTNEAWQSVKHGLINSVSIGFRIVDNAVERIETGLRFLKTEILELSIVPIPANPGALILSTRGAAQGRRATVSRSPVHVVKLTPGAILLGKATAEFEERRERNRRLGIREPVTVVKLLTPAELEMQRALADGEALLRRLNDRNRSTTKSNARGHVVRLNPNGKR